MTLTPEQRLRNERAAIAARIFDEVRGRPMILPEEYVPPVVVAEQQPAKPAKMRAGEQAE